MPVIHGHTINGKFSPTYHSWASMRTRVTNPNTQHAKYYAERGIDCDPQWRVFANFLEDMGERPDGCSLERKDVNRGYWPDNCCWIDTKQQARNTRQNKWVTLNGERMLFTEAAKLLGRVSFSVTRVRQKRGYDHQAMIDYWVEHKCNGVMVTLDGESMTCVAAARRLGRKTLGATYYMKRGFPNHQAVLDYHVAKRDIGHAASPEAPGA